MRAMSASIRCVALGASCAAAVSVPLSDEAVDLLPIGGSMRCIVLPTLGWMRSRWPQVRCCYPLLLPAAAPCSYQGDVGAEVGGPAHVGPLLGLRGTGSGRL